MRNSWLDKTQGQNIGREQQALGPHNFTKSAPMIFNVFAFSGKKRAEKRVANVPADLNCMTATIAHSVV